jgi:hypothetical protein
LVSIDSVQLLHFKPERQYYLLLQVLDMIMPSDFAEYCFHIRRLQTGIARCAIWINIPVALLNFILVQLDGFALLPTLIRPLLASCILSLALLVISALPMMLLAEFWEMWWNPLRKRCLCREEQQNVGQGKATPVGRQ